MTGTDASDDRPSYGRGDNRWVSDRGSRARDFATQILDTTAPFLQHPVSRLAVLDVGCGYGHTSVELARRCARVVGIEPSETLFRYACQLREDSHLENLEFLHVNLYDLSERERYDLIVLDNVLEHLPDQPRALRILSNSLRPDGIAYVLVPNRLWPIEAHYHLPFLSYLPVKLANAYLRITGRGVDYTDASYAPTYCSLNRMLRSRPELSFEYVLPAHIELATFGRSLHYRIGASLIRRFPWLWIVSKVLLVVIKKMKEPSR